MALRQIRGFIQIRRFQERVFYAAATVGPAKLLWRQTVPLLSTIVPELVWPEEIVSVTPLLTVVIMPPAFVMRQLRRWPGSEPQIRELS